MFPELLPRLIAFKFLGLFSLSSPSEAVEGNKQHDDSSQLATKCPTDPYKTAKGQSSKEIARLMLVKGIPGLTICVAKKGKTAWSSAFGFCDVENHLQCTPDARMRIASISKTLFASTVIAPMIEDGNLDIKDSVHKYLSHGEFPRQQFDGKKYDITIEQLLAHTSGIKHYGDANPDDLSLRPIGSTGSPKVYQGAEQYNRTGFYQRSTFRNVIEALQPFKDGPLEKEPGTFRYTTYGYTVLSAVAQKVLESKASKDANKQEQIEDYWMKILRRDWKLSETNLDQDEPILPNRSRYYCRSLPNGGLVNATYVDNSVKWAGGGLISTVSDLAKFGSALIDSHKGRVAARLKKSTLEQLWTQRDKSYCLGFFAQTLEPADGSKDTTAFYHTGSAAGASSVLIIYPESEIVVAILTNLENVNLKDVGFKVADHFAGTK